MKYFLYIRKSTDEDDRQVLSLEAQETELKEFALRENLLIAATFRESQTAKEPGRPIFNDMLKNGERRSRGDFSVASRQIGEKQHRRRTSYFLD